MRIVSSCAHARWCGDGAGLLPLLRVASHHPCSRGSSDRCQSPGPRQRSRGERARSCGRGRPRSPSPRRSNPGLPRQLRTQLLPRLPGPRRTQRAPCSSRDSPRPQKSLHRCRSPLEPPGHRADSARCLLTTDRASARSLRSVTPCVHVLSFPPRFGWIHICLQPSAASCKVAGCTCAGQRRHK